MMPIKTGRGVVGKVLVSLLLLPFCLWQSSVLAAAIATVDRTEISEFELLSLRLRASEEHADLAPDFSGLERDFQILSTQTSQSSSFTLTNGGITSLAHKDYVLSLKPQRLGTLNIPSIQVGNAATAPINIRVTKQSAAARQQMNQLVFFESEVDTTVAYVQGQILHRLKLFYTQGSTGQFPQPLVLDDAIVEVIDNEKRYQRVVNGRSYYVIERRTAIFPQRSGTLLLPPETFIGTFSTGGFRSQSRPINAVSKAHRITVKRVPASFSGTDWIPAKSLLLSGAWSSAPPSFRVGEPTNRVLKLSALGLSASLLPAFSEVSVPNVKIYSDPPATEKQIVADGIMVTQVTNISILPTQVGTLTLPEIRIPWWNITTDQEAVAILPAATYQILPAAGIGVPAPPRVPGPGSAFDRSTPEPLPGFPVWQYIALALGCLLLIATWQWFSVVRQLRAVQSADRQQDTQSWEDPDEASHYRALIQACRGHQAATAQAQLLLWARAQYPQLHALSDLEGVVPAEVVEEIAALEAVLYRAGNQPEWQGNRLARRVTALREERQAEQRSSSALRARRGALSGGLNPV